MHVIDALRPQVDTLIVVGREFSGQDCIADRERGLGPLGGLCSALCAARARGCDAVLTSGCDLLDIPLDLAARLAPGPAAALGQPLLGLWPVALTEALEAHILTDDRSMRGWVAASGARTVDFGPITNVNTSRDLPPKQGVAGREPPPP